MTIHNTIPGGLLTLPSCTPCQPGLGAITLMGADACGESLTTVSRGGQ